MSSTTRGFIFRLMLFALPLMIVFGAILGLAIYSGEAMPYRLVLALQASDRSVIYRRKHMIPQESFAYKQVALTIRPPPAILMLGSSRVLVFQSNLLTDPSDFYNAGMPGAYIDGVEAWVNALTPETAPDILMIGVDLFWFNVSLEVAQRDAGTFSPVMDDPTWVLESVRRVVKDLVCGEHSLMDLWARRDPLHNGIALGLDAQDTGIGYRWDGSMQSNPAYLAENSRNRPAESYMLFPPTQAGREIIHRHFRTLDSLLARADDLGITVIGFLPPYMPEMYDFMRGSGIHGYFEAARVQVKRVFAEHEVVLFDFSDVRTIGGDSSNMSDFVHPTPELAAHMFRLMARDIPALQGYARFATNGERSYFEAR